LSSENRSAIRFGKAIRTKVFGKWTKKPQQIQEISLDNFRLAQPKINLLAPVVRKVINSIQRINPSDKVVCFINIYPLDSDLSGSPAFEQPGPEL